MFTAKDVMNEKVLSIAADSTLQDAARFLVDHHISGAPVVDASGQLVGIISEYQLLAMAYNATIKSQHVRDYMTKEVMSVEVDTKLSDIANLFILQRIRRVPVLSQGRMVGVISRSDLLRHALRGEKVANELVAIGTEPEHGKAQ